MTTYFCVTPFFCIFYLNNFCCLGNHSLYLKFISFHVCYTYLHFTTLTWPDLTWTFLNQILMWDLCYHFYYILKKIEVYVNSSIKYKLYRIWYRAIDTFIGQLESTKRPKIIRVLARVWVDDHPIIAYCTVAYLLRCLERLRVILNTKI